MINTVKKNKSIRLARQTGNRTAGYSGRMGKYAVLFAAFFLTACQTMSGQNESSAKSDSKQTDSKESELVQKPMAQKDPAQKQTVQQKVQQEMEPKSDEPAKTATDFTQSRAPMSEATKKRLKGHAQELINDGSIPQINYQQPASPDLPMTADGGVAGKGPEPIQLNYEQVEIRQILEEFADVLGIDIIIDPSITGSVTMRTAPNSTLTKEDLWPLLQMLVDEAGVVLEKRNGVYHAKRSKQALPSAIGTAAILDATDASLVMQVTPLKHVSIDAAMTVLKPIAGPKGRIVPMPNLNTLLIIDNPEQLKRLNGLLSLVDSNPFKHRGIHLYKLKEAEAKNVAKELNEVLKLIEGNKPAYQVMGLERINALLVVAPPGRGFKEVSRWVDILDAGADEELVEQIFIYKCKSLKATSLAATLNAVFLQEDKTKKKEKKEEVAKPYEFKTASKESLSFESAVKRAADKKAGTKQTPKAGDKKTQKSTNDDAASANIKVTIVADEDSNSLLVRTTAKDYKQLLQTIRTLDVVPLQVLINVVIAQVALTDSQSFGIDWAYLGSSGTVLQTNFGQASRVDDNGDPLGLIINRITGDWRVTINALAKDGDVNILSRPSLLITNNQEGVINVGAEVPVRTETQTSQEGITNTEQIAYRKTGIELTVTPQINEDGIINMNVQQSLSAVEGDTEGETDLNPTFTNQEIGTNVVVRDKETIILGGLIDTVETESEQGVPVLKDVPLMGNLFKTQSTNTSRRELILIISTQIVNADESYDAFNEAFKSRYNKAAVFLDKQLLKTNKEYETQ